MSSIQGGPKLPPRQKKQVSQQGHVNSSIPLKGSTQGSQTESAVAQGGVPVSRTASDGGTEQQPVDKSAKRISETVSRLVQQRPDLLHHVGREMNVPVEQLLQRMQHFEQHSKNMSPQLMDQLSRMEQSVSNAMKSDVSSLGHNDVESGKSDLFEDEKTQDWMYMYRKSFLSYTDLVFAPVFISIASVFFWLNMMPLQISLWLLPLLFVILSACCLIRIAGVDKKLLPFSRLPGSLVLSIELLALIVFYVSVMDLVIQDHWPFVIGLYMLGGGVIASHILTMRTDPGFLPTGPLPPPMPREQLMMLQRANPYHCLTCGIYKPIRSKHCFVCDRCVPEFDHHCSVVMNCIGAGNSKLFTTYLFLLPAAEIFWWSLNMLGMQRYLHGLPEWSDVSIQPTSWDVLANIFVISKTLPGTAFVMVLMVLIMLATAFMTLRQIFCIVAGLTPNECIVRHRYDYLKAEDLSFFNPFDLGPMENCINFWSRKRPDWYSIYRDRTDLDPTTSVPRWSVTRLIRHWDSVKQQLHEIRLRKQKQREEFLLKRYGGVHNARPEETEPMSTHSGCRGCHMHE